MRLLEAGINQVVAAFAPAAAVVEAGQRSATAAQTPNNHNESVFDNPSEYERAVAAMHRQFPDVAGSDEFLLVAEAHESGEISSERAIDSFALLALNTVLAGRQ